MINVKMKKKLNSVELRYVVTFSNKLNILIVLMNDKFEICKNK